MAGFFSRGVAVAAGATAMLASLLVAAPAVGAVSMSVSLTEPASTSVGGQGIDAQVTVVNTSTAPDDTKSITLSTILYTPACGGTLAGASCTSSPDPAVFSVVPDATVQGGASCNDGEVPVNSLDAGTGEVTLQSFQTLTLGPASGSQAAKTCTFTIYMTASNVPTHDSDTVTDGLQTQAGVSIAGDTTGAGSVHVSGSDTTSLTVKAMPTLTNSQLHVSSGTRTNDTVSGTITLGGYTSPASQFSALHGDVAFRAYNTADCSGQPVLTMASQGAGPGPYNVGPQVLPGPGTYYFVASYGGDPYNAALTDACGADGIDTVPKDTPGLAAQASGGPTTADGISDAATIMGGTSPTGTITFLGYPNSACTGTPSVSTTLSVDGDGPYASGSLIPPAAGIYHFTASYSGDADNNTVTTQCTAAGQSITVTKATPSLTIADSASGTTIVGTAVLSGGGDPTGSVTINAYGPSAQDCSGTPAFTTNVNVNGNGSYSGTFTGADPGIYRFNAAYDGDAGNNGAASACSGPVTVAAPGPPTVTVTAPVSGATYAFGEVVAASYKCSDPAGGPGISSCVGTVMTGTPIGTSTAGPRQFAVTATSRDGQTSTQTISYTVAPPSNRFRISHLKIHHGTVSFTAKLPGPGQLTATEKRGPAPIGGAHHHVKKSGSVQVNVKLNGTGRKLLAHHSGTIKATLSVTYKPTGGTPRTTKLKGIKLAR
jgi:hypothetical protein